MGPTSSHAVPALMTPYSIEKRSDSPGPNGRPFPRASGVTTTGARVESAGAALAAGAGAAGVCAADAASGSAASALSAKTSVSASAAPSQPGPPAAAPMRLCFANRCPLSLRLPPPYNKRRLHPPQCSRPPRAARAPLPCYPDGGSMLRASDRLNNVAPYALAKVFASRDAKIAQGVDVIDLGVGNPDMRPAPH